MNIAGEVLKYQNYLSIDDIPMNVVKLSFTNLTSNIRMGSIVLRTFCFFGD